jgi:drug/metabolite transporter (DMT)-like permease
MSASCFSLDLARLGPAFTFVHNKQIAGLRLGMIESFYQDLLSAGTNVFNKKTLYFALLSNGILFGSQYFLINRALSEISVLGLSALRLMFSFVFMIFVSLSTGVWHEIKTIKPVFQCLLLSLFGEIASPLFIAYASKALSSSTVGLGVTMAPFVTLLLSSLVFQHERLSVRQFFAMLFGFGGVTILLLPSLSGLEQENVLPMLSLCLGAITLGLVNIIGSRISDIGTISASTLACFWGAVFTVPAYFIMERGGINLPVLAFPTWACIAALGVGINAIGTLLFLWTAKRAGASFASYVGFIIPCVAVGLGCLAGEPITIAKIVALFSIIVGLAFLRPRSTNNRQNSILVPPPLQKT